MHHAQDFYEKLFGWDVERGAEGTSDYLVCRKDEQPVAGLEHKYDDDAPPFWTTYFATDDIEASCDAVRAAGGKVLTEPFEVPGSSRAAYCADTTGAFFGLWQDAGLIGFGIVDEPGAVAWNDLMTRDLEASKAFYTNVFGYSYVEQDSTYLTAQLPSGETVAGIHLTEPDTPPSWLVHFEVADRDSSAQIAQELGASILLTLETPFGPEAILQGQHGEVFGVFAANDSQA